MADKYDLDLKSVNELYDDFVYANKQLAMILTKW